MFIANPNKRNVAKYTHHTIALPIVPTTTAAGFLLGLNNPELPFGPKLTESNFDHASY